MRSFRRPAPPARFDPLAGAGFRYLAFAVAALLASLLLGTFLSGRPPGRFELGELGAYGVATPLAKILTAAGRFPVYSALSFVVVVFGIARRSWMTRALVSVALLVVVWQTSDLAKALFHRARPLDPIVPETSFGYPSGHADLAIAFFGFWAFWIGRSEMSRPVKIAVVALLAAWTLAIGWSRLALGAHFPGDVLGGYLFGSGWLAIAIVVSADLQRRAAEDDGGAKTMGVRISRR